MKDYFPLPDVSMGRCMRIWFLYAPSLTFLERKMGITVHMGKLLTCQNMYLSKLTPDGSELTSRALCCQMPINLGAVQLLPSLSRDGCCPAPRAFSGLERRSLTSVKLQHVFTRTEVNCPSQIGEDHLVMVYSPVGSDSHQMLWTKHLFDVIG